MENRKAEKKKVGIGAGVLILIVVAFWALGKKPAEAAALGIPVDIYRGTIYEGMTAAQAWAYHYQLVAEQEARLAAGRIAVKAYIADPEKAEAEQLEELGITRAELPTYKEFALQINMELGGSYVAGVLTPPASWVGSVTAWSRHVQDVTFTRYHQMYG